jgi:hypothetical protein
MSLLNKSQVRRYALEKAAELRPKMADGQPRFTRVNPELYTELEALLKVRIVSKIHQAPSKGRTL